MQIAIQELLTCYRSTPHPATGMSPYEAMLNRQVRIKLDYTGKDSPNRREKDNVVDERDRLYKFKLKNNAEDKTTRVHTFAVEHHVLLKQKKTNKWTMPYEPEIYIVYKVRGSSIWARRKVDGREVCHDSTYFKHVHVNRWDMYKGKATKRQHDTVKEDNWRETTLRKAKVGLPETNIVEPNNQYPDEESTDPRPELVEETIPRRSQKTRKKPNHYGDLVYY